MTRLDSISDQPLSFVSTGEESLLRGRRGPTLLIQTDTGGHPLLVLYGGGSATFLPQTSSPVPLSSLDLPWD